MFVARWFAFVLLWFDCVVWVVLLVICGVCVVLFGLVRCGVYRCVVCCLLCVYVLCVVCVLFVVCVVCLLLCVLLLRVLGCVLFCVGVCCVDLVWFGLFWFEVM